jgi:hypothetical protein
MSPEWVLVAVGIATAVVIGYQSWATMRAAKATERMVEPAKAQLQHIVNSERSWILDTLTWGGHGGLVKITDPAGIHSVAEIDLFWRNHGNTPAWISEVSVKMEVTSAGPARKPDLTGAEVFYGPVPVVPGNPPNRDGHRFQLSCNGFAEESHQMTLIYGVIRYRDSFTPEGKNWETWFGYRVVEHNATERLAHPEYNKNA